MDWNTTLLLWLVVGVASIVAGRWFVRRARARRVAGETDTIVTRMAKNEADWEREREARLDALGPPLPADMDDRAARAKAAALAVHEDDTRLIALKLTELVKMMEQSPTALDNDYEVLRLTGRDVDVTDEKTPHLKGRARMLAKGIRLLGLERQVRVADDKSATLVARWPAPAWTVHGFRSKRGES